MSFSNGDKVVVTTQYRGVFFGTIKEYDRPGRVVVLADAHCCVYWPSSTRGFLGLARVGPLDGARVGPAADEIELHGVTSLSACSADAAARWEAAPWS